MGIKEPKVCVLQANAKLAQKGECWTWNQRFSGSILNGGNILLLEILFSRSTASDANTGIIANFISIASKCFNKSHQGLTHNLAKTVDTEFDYMWVMGTRAHRKHGGKGDTEHKAKWRQMRVWGYGDKVSK